MNAGERSGYRGWHHPLFIQLVMFVLLFCLWLVLSGLFYIEFIVAGAISSAAVVVISGPLMHPATAEEYRAPPRSFRWLGGTILRFLVYLLWLTKEIAIANLEVTYQVLHPSLPISPRLMRFRTALRMEPSQLLFAHSITLTPGTVTVDLNRNEFIIHSLSYSSLEAVAEGRMQQKIARTFGESDLSDVVSMELIDDVRELRK